VTWAIILTFADGVRTRGQWTNMRSTILYAVSSSIWLCRRIRKKKIDMRDCQFHFVCPHATI